MTSSDLRIAFTPGEPAGIGPDLAVMLAQSPPPYAVVAIADPDLLRERANTLSLPLEIDVFRPGQPAAPARPGRLTVAPVALRAVSRPGRLDTANAEYVLDTLRRAVEFCRTSQCDAMVTGPVQKSIIIESGVTFTGHTEFLAQLTGADWPVMMLATEGLRVALATIHMPLRNVAEALTVDRLTRTLKVLITDLKRRYGLTRPRVLVAGLNPHAGEGGHLGREEIEVIQPVLEQFRDRGEAVTGPLPADTLFTPKYLSQADAVLAMYHDQGLPIIKHLGFGRTVNVTLGLPIIRTSVDHGTALDLAATGQADAGSLNAAVGMAAELASHARAHSG